MNKKKKIIIFSIIQICILFGLIFIIFIDKNKILNLFENENLYYEMSNNCDLRKTSCKVDIDENTTLELDIKPREIPLMKNLTFSLKTKNINAQNLNMKIYATNMDMGVFPFKFSQQANNNYKANGILPTCIIGGMIWKAEIKIQQKTKNQIAVFSFKTDI